MDLKHCAILSLFLGITGSLRAQDENSFRDLFLYSDRQKAKSKKQKNYHFKARTNRHLFDMNGDDRPESLYAAKHDGEDWLFVFDNKGKEAFRYRLNPVGPWSRLFKIQKRMLSDNSTVFLLYFFEGTTKYINFQGTSRLYLMTMDNKDLKTLSVYKGPILWDEVRDFKDHYHQRKYEVSLFDYDKDDVREVTVKYGRMSRVYRYAGEGKWLNLNDQEALDI